MKPMQYAGSKVVPARYTAEEMRARDRLIREFLKTHKIKKCPTPPHAT